MDVNKFLEERKINHKTENKNLLQLMTANYGKRRKGNQIIEKKQEKNGKNEKNEKQEETEEKGEILVTPMLMYDLLVAPVKQLLSKDKKKVVFVPCEELWQFPFNSLIESDSKKLFIQSYCVSISPSYRVLFSSAQKVSERAEKLKNTLNPNLIEKFSENYQKALLIASPPHLCIPSLEDSFQGERDSESHLNYVFESSQKLDPLPLSEKEISAISTVLSNQLSFQSVQSFYNKKECNSTFFVENSVGCKYIHLSTYGTMDGMILFSGGGVSKECFVDPKLVSCMNLIGTEFVVLNLRYESSNSFSSFISLACSFINAGVRYVLLSLPGSEEKSIVKHGYFYYKFLAENPLDVPLAFQKASLQLAKEHQGDNALFSSFILLGC